jgi:hypothetical protein
MEGEEDTRQKAPGGRPSFDDSQLLRPALSSNTAILKADLYNRYAQSAMKEEGEKKMKRTFSVSIGSRLSSPLATLTLHFFL